LRERIFPLIKRPTPVMDALGLKPAVYQLTRGTFRKYKDVCEDCLWPEMRSALKTWPRRTSLSYDRSRHLPDLRA